MGSKDKEQPKKATRKKSTAKAQVTKAPAKKAAAKKSSAKKAAASKPAAKKAAAGKQPQSKRDDSPKVQPVVSPDERRKMIAEAAFRRAEERHFQESDPVGDWLAAEREIDRKIESSAGISRHA